GIANVALALAKGENAGAQSLGAMTAEAVGMLSEKLYNKPASQLTEDEKATVSAFASLAAGIAGGLVGGDTSSAGNAAQAGKTTVENNSLSNKDVFDLRKELIKATETGADKELIFDQFRELSKKKREQAVADAKEGKITASITSWSDVLTGVDQADSLKWIAWIDSLSADDRKALVNLVKNENEITAAAIFNSATPEVKLALGGKEGLDKIGMAGVGNSTGITVISTAIKGNKGNEQGKSPNLPTGYNTKDSSIIGPKGSTYSNTGKTDASGNTVYSNNGGYYTFENGVKTKVPSPNPPTNVQLNSEKGKEFESSIFDEIKSNPSLKTPSREITIETNKGTKVRIDIMAKDENGNIKCIECKSSQTAPFTKNQEKGFPELKAEGGTVVGKGKPGFEGGTKIPPTEVEVVRPKVTDN
ncbi:VENN motif pre-toxin domain-containing protein, partial [Providencia huaxiensis]